MFFTIREIADVVFAGHASCQADEGETCSFRANAGVDWTGGARDVQCLPSRTLGSRKMAVGIL